jgi:hypothetical protein
VGSFKWAAISAATPLWRLTPTAAKAKYGFGEAGCLENSHRSLGGRTARPDTLPRRTTRVGGVCCNSGMLEDAAIAVRLRRLWIGKIAGSPEMAASALAGIWSDRIDLVRDREQLVLVGPPSAQQAKDEPVADTLLAAVKAVSSGSVSGLKWRSTKRLVSPARAKTSDLDIFHADDPLLDAYADVLADLKAAIPAETGTEARAALSKLRLVAVSRHRLWLAAPNIAARDAVGTTLDARAALVRAVQEVQDAKVPLYRVVVDPCYRTRAMLL